MSDWYLWLRGDDFGFVCKRVMFIPCGDGSVLRVVEWNRINSTIEGML